MVREGSNDTSLVRKKKKVYCHFKSAWKSQEFTVTVGGAEEKLSGAILSGVEVAMTLSAHCAV